MAHVNSFRSRRWMTILLVSLAIILTLGVILYALYVTGPQSMTLIISEPAGETVYYDVVIDGVAESGVVIAPATLKYQGHDFAFAVIPRDDTSQVSVELLTRDTQWKESGPGVRGGYKYSVWKRRSAVSAMAETHVNKMRESRNSTTATTH